MAFIKKHKRLSVLIVFIIGLLFLCFSPYFFVFANNKLNTIFSSHQIKIGDYFTYISATFTGFMAIAISVLALIISTKNERREQNRLIISISISKKKVHDYISSCSLSFYEIWKKQKAADSLSLPDDIEQHIETLKVNNVLTNEEADLCLKMQSFVKQALDKRRSENDVDLSNRFCLSFIDMKSPDYSPAQSVLELLKKLN